MLLEQGTCSAITKPSKPELFDGLKSRARPVGRLGNVFAWPAAKGAWGVIGAPRNSEVLPKEPEL
eukprot:6962861-Alexandrium_andersonii.AAC.1